MMTSLQSASPTPRARSGIERVTPVACSPQGEGRFAIWAANGGSPTHPTWYYNLKADPASVAVQDGPDKFDVAVRELDGDERAQWWERAVAAFPPYAEYQQKTERTIPVFLATRKG